MQRKNYYAILTAAGLLLVLATGFWLIFAQPVSAQCGSQASSCKNCHEVQAQKPVNSDGTGWHQSHAFGDFCYICHGGNQQSTDKATAHAGMVSPLSDVKAACQSCHVKDYMDRAKIYADKLGVTIGTGGAAAAAGSATAVTTQAAPAANSNATTPPSGQVVIENNPGTVDYVEQYNQSVLGKVSINWGNMIVGALIVLLVVFGGAFVYFNEKKLRGAAVQTEVSSSTGTKAIKLEDYPADVIALLPQIKELNPVGRRALGKILANPAGASELLLSLSRIDPELIQRMKGLDREAQAILFALAGE